MNALLEKIRLLPVLIFVGVLLLTVKVGGLIEGFSKGNVEVSLAAKGEAQQTNPVQPKPIMLAQAPPTAPTPVPAAEPSPPAAQAPILAPPPSQALSTPVPSGEPGAYTAAELEVLQKLSKRRDELEARAKEMQMREDLAKAAEARLAKKLEEMKQVQSTIEGLLRKYDDQEDVKMKSLVKIYESMKPKDAAKIFEQLDMPILLDVIERMKEQKAAAVLADMSPQKAKEVTAEIADRRKLPRPGAGSGG
jgi:flagellar motility protein MotE (MotC chaperone)